MARTTTRSNRRWATLIITIVFIVSLGPKGSGNRVSAIRVLDHFGIDEASIGNNELYFKHLLDTTSELDAAIVTAGIGHPDLAEVLGTKQFDLLPVADTEAVETLHPYLSTAEVPRVSLPRIHRFPQRRFRQSQLLHIWWLETRLRTVLSVPPGPPCTRSL